MDESRTTILGSRVGSLLLLVLMPIGVVAIGMSLPLLRGVYERPVFLWISLSSAAVLGAGLAITPFRARTPLKRRLFCFGMVSAVALVRILALYHDYGSPPLWVASPEVLAFFRELVHIVEYGLVAFLAARILQDEIGGPLLYLTVMAYVFIIGIADESVQWLHAFRVGDTRDVATNGLSAGLGLLYRAGLAPAPPWKMTYIGKGLALFLLPLPPLLFTEFYVRTQIGHRICDERQNCFISNYRASDLDHQARERATRWAGKPRGSLAREAPRFWAGEDYFLTEARAHFRLANEAAAKSDWDTACGELHIVTAHFEPAVRVLGVRPQDYPCSSAPEGFNSRAFAHLETEARPMAWRTLAALAALAVLALAMQRLRLEAA